MIELGHPIATSVALVVALWWASTALILFLNHLPQRTYRFSMGVASVLAAAAVYGLIQTSLERTPDGAYRAFALALVIWGWHEMSFLMGFITGPVKTPCPPNARWMQRFVLATRAIVNHEMALIVTIVLVGLLTRGAPNQIGFLTLLLLWSMRLSTKLNLFLGVRNWSESFLPAHLRYLESFFRRRTINPLFPWSILFATAIVTMCVNAVLAPGSDAFEVIGAALLGALAALALLEHGFLVLPLDATRLWRWAQATGPATNGKPPLPYNGKER